ncbi:MAG: citrate synthase [Pseudomonadota bacterium]
MSNKDHSQIISRDIQFAERATTRIWQETASEDNPYIAAGCRCHGYDLQELMHKRSFVEVFYLLFRGELPSGSEAELLEHLMIALINPGPRHPATRAAINTAVGKTDPAHILPIGMMVLSGEHLGGIEVEASMRFIRKRLRDDPQCVAGELLESERPPAEGDWHIAPGFGNRFGGIDIMPGKIAAQLAQLPGSGKALAWGEAFARALQPHDMGWLTSGIAAAAFCDLGFQPRAAAGLLQILSAPGLLAHGLEYANKPITALPRISDEDYHIGKK